MVALLILLTTLTSFAQFDLGMGIQGRTVPGLGAELYADSGYNQIFWGEKKDPKDFMYGLIRPSLGVSTSAVVNSVKGEFEFFPISILGLAVGRQIQNSNFEFPFLECKEVTCTGEYIRNYGEAKMVLGVKGWIALGNYKIDTLRSPDKDRPMADWRNVIVGTPGEEVQIERKLLVGKMFSNKMIGFLAENVQFLGSRERKESYALVYQVRQKETNYMVGAGSFRTSQQAQSLIFYFRIHYQPLPSLKLF